MAGLVPAIPINKLSVYERSPAMTGSMKPIMSKAVLTGTMLVVAAFLPAPLFTADLPEPPAASARPSAPGLTPTPAPDGDVTIYNPDPSCGAWTDGCRNCQRDPAGKVSCNNIGIACQPQAVTCERK
jgi:hypothetical protein